MYAIMSESNIVAYVSTVRSPFSSRLIAYNFSSIPIAFRRFITWIALGDADLCFSLILVRKANAVEVETK
jgi:ABC-type glycerol-3-phosphate transport system permease component